MGNLLATFLRDLFAKTTMRVLMVGLDAAGKTTILYNLKLGEIVTTIPTIGNFAIFNFEMIVIGSQIGFLKVLTLRQLNTKTYHSPYGMLAVRAKSDLCGDITFRAHR